MKRPRPEEDLEALLDLMSAAQHHGQESMNNNKKKGKTHPPPSSTSGKKGVKDGHDNKAGSRGSKRHEGTDRAHAGGGVDEKEEGRGEEEEEEDGDDSTYQVASGGAMSLVWRQDVKPPAAASSGSRRRLSPDSYRFHPLLAIEVQRHDLVASLSVLFLNAIKSMNLDMKVVSFERWLLVQQQKADPGSAADPLLPDLGGKKDPDRLLVAELLEAGASKKEAKRLSNYLAKSSTKAVRQLQRQFPGGATASTNQGSKVTLHEEEGGSYSVRWRSTSFKVNKGHYDKLRVLYQRHGGRGREGDHGRFLEHVFLVLARYDALAGGTDRGGGFQGALNNTCFDILLRHFDCRMECFASPLNCRYGRFCSAFADSDAVFGSIGSFFNFHPREGCFEANPPFVPYMMDKMSTHMQALLVEAKSQGRALCFIVVIPTWSPDKNTRAIQKASRPSWESLRQSPFCVEHLVLKANEHGYCEGSQHRLPTRYKSSRFDTSVFFLQTPAARTKWRVTKEACEELRMAFASRHEEETRLRRAGAKEGDVPVPGPIERSRGSRIESKASPGKIVQKRKQKLNQR